jgi:two-component system response regulator DevR
MLAIRVFLVDAHEVTRRGVTTVLAADPHIRVVGEAESMDQARRRALAVRPDVAVVDGAPLCADLRSVLPGMRCLVLGQDVSPEAVSAAIQAGASGYLVKDAHSAELVAAVRRVAAGHILFAAATIALSEPSFNGHHQNRLALQTARERQLLQLLADVDQRPWRRHRRTGRTGRERRRHGDGEAACQQQDRYGLRCMQHRQGQVPAPEADQARVVHARGDRSGPGTGCAAHDDLLEGGRADAATLPRHRVQTPDGNACRLRKVSLSSSGKGRAAAGPG